MPELHLSGNVYTADEVEILELADEDPESLPDAIRDDIVNGDRLALGDLKVYSQLDERGRMAARGSHTNFGYSGYFAASIYDGTRWRRFEIRTIVPVNESCFASQGDKPVAFARVRDLVKLAKGCRCVWSVPEGRQRGRYAATPAPGSA